MENSLYRDEQRKVIGGVCAGLSDYFKVEPSVVRLIFLLGLILHGTSLLAYIVLWIVLPNKKTFGAPAFDFAMPPLDQETFMPAKKSPSTTVIVIGGILIAFGALFLLNNFDLLPDLDYANFWPVILIAIGLAMIFSNKKKDPAFKLPKDNVDEAASAPENPEMI